jgi:hypothetical protein
MLYRFKSDAGADVLMLAENAEALLRLMGREAQAPGIFEVADLPRWRSALEAAVAADEAAFDAALAQAKAAGEPIPRRQGVSLRQRAWPLRELMRQSERGGVAVVWGV